MTLKNGRPQAIIKHNNIKSLYEKKEQEKYSWYGFPTASWDWYLLWPKLVEKYHVIAPDLLGFGFSNKPQLSLQHTDQANMIEALLQDKDRAG